MQGSASLALEIMIVNFLYGKVLLIDTGFYSRSFIQQINSSLIKMNNNVKDLEVINWKMNKVKVNLIGLFLVIQKQVVELNCLSSFFKKLQTNYQQNLCLMLQHQ